jgi:hypothetical protein
MRKAILCLAPALATIILFACDDTSSMTGGGSFTFDGGEFDRIAPNYPDGAVIPDGAVPDADAEAIVLPVTVIVTANLKPEAGVVVVWHDANGAVLSTTTTDATGKAVSTGATPAMASALLGSEQGDTQVVTWTGVAAGDILRTNDITGNNTGSVSSYSVTVPAPAPNVTGAVDWTARTGECYSGTANDFGVAQDVALYPDCATSPGAVLAYSHDDTFTTINGFSFMKNLFPVTDGGTVNATTGAWAPPATANLTVANLPAGQPVQGFLAEIASSVSFRNQDGPNVDSTTLPATFHIATGFADAMQFGIRYTPTSASFASTLVIGKRTAPSTSLAVDFADALPTLTDATLDSTDGVRPTLSWTSASPLTGTDGGSASITWYVSGTEANHGWTVIVGPNATNARLPALPTTAAAWAPPDPDAGITTFDAPRVIFAESDLLPSYKELRAIAGFVIPLATFTGDPLTSAALPTNGKLRLTEYQLLPQ